MNSLMHYLSRDACIVGGTVAYPAGDGRRGLRTMMEFAGNFGVSVSVRDVWIGISAIAITVALRLDRLLSRGQ